LTQTFLPASAVALTILLQASVSAGGTEACQSHADCDDGDPCTDDACANNMSCVHFPPCDDNDPCTEDTCTPETGCVNTVIPCPTTTTIPLAEGCGDPNDSGGIPTASDAMIVLQAAVGISPDACDLCSCDVTNDGTISAIDSLGVLQYAVGIVNYLDCPQC
jgi:hypothetical protein